MAFKIWQSINNSLGKLNQQNTLTFAGGMGTGITYTHKLQQSITNIFSIPEVMNDGDDLDAIIDTIFIPEPIDQPTPVEPVGQGDNNYTNAFKRACNFN